MISKFSRKSFLQLTGFITFFVMMCVLKLWYTLFLFFALALLLTISLRRRFFCRSICPLGAVQDFAGSNSKKIWKLNSTFKKIFVTVVWFLWIFIVEFSYKQPTLIWFQLLRISVVFVITAILLQFVFKRRTWCLSLCPLAPLLRKAAKLQKPLK